MQCACAIPSSVACPALQYVPYYLTNGTIFGKTVIEQKKSALICSITRIRKISHSEKNLARYANIYIYVYIYIGVHLKYSSFLSDFNENLFFFSKDFGKNTQMSNFMKIRSGERWVVPCGWTNGRTDRHVEANGRLPLFCERAIKPKTISWTQHTLFIHTSNSYKFRLLSQTIIRLYEIL